MVNLYSRLYLYLYYIFLVSFLSVTTAHALEPLEIKYGGFAENMFCTHPTDLAFCVAVTKLQAKQLACGLWLSSLQSGQAGGNRQYNDVYVATGGPQGQCIANYTNTSDGSKGSNSISISMRVGQCPAQGSPSPTPISFSRQGRWYAPELGNKVCWKKCEYQGQFEARHIVYTNGVVTTFDSITTSSNATFCEMLPEPVRDSDGEITYDSNCDNQVFEQFCDFMNWMRADLPLEPPPVTEVQQSDFDQYLKTDHVDVDGGLGTTDMQCFAPQEINLYLPWVSTEVKQTISYQPICDGLTSFGNFLRALYLLHAALIIFRR